jgi:DnaJ-class molecular chaperone
MNKFKDIEEARKILGLGETASLEEIRQAYYKLSLKYHPDKCKGKNKKKCEEKFKEINRAYKIVMNYCINYKFSFRERDVKKTNIDDQIYENFMRFFDDWWGKLSI